MRIAYLPLIKKAVKEDLGKNGDITSDSIVPVQKKGRAVLKSKSSGIISGLEVFEDTFFFLDRDLKIETFFRDGDRLIRGDIVAIIKGNLNSILKAERTALNFIQRMSGISTLTSEFVKAVEGTGTTILDTRKTLPGFRTLDKYAVAKGGGKNHRTGLFDMFLIKDNHISSAGSIKEAVKMVLEYKKQKKLRSLIEVEVKTVSEFKEALDLELDRIMLDNMDIDQIRECISLNKGSKELEISGNVNIDSVSALAGTGVDYISIGSLTHSVKAFDLSLLVEQERS
ncbi:MAG: carboxylating nicotinate-nucleotide diphosphorylase [Candidatus Delongbacteria bacterium]